MVEDAHSRAVSYLVSKCPSLPVVSVLAYGSYARGDYRRDSDVDVLVVVDSSRYSSADLKSLVQICIFCKREFAVMLQVAGTVMFGKFRMKKELMADEFIELVRVIKGYVK